MTIYVKLICLYYIQTYVYIKSTKEEDQMDTIQLITDNGVDTIVIALGTVVFTGLFKIPIKKLAAKTKNSKKITRFVTFLPILFGFGLTVLSAYLLTNQVSFSKEFYVQWLSSVSLSLAIYAFWEKFVPFEKQILSEAEIKANMTVVEELKSKLAENDGFAEVPTYTEKVTLPFDEVECGQAVNNNNNKNKQ